MSAFSDQLLMQFLQDSFVQNLVTNQLGLPALLGLTYDFEEIEIKEVSLATVQRREFEVPAFETLRTTGIEEQIMPTPERVKVDRAQARRGRLAWIDVFLELQLTTKVHSTAAPIESITVNQLVDKIGNVASFAELRAKLAALYPPSIVDAFFEKLPISSVDEFMQRGNLFVEFVYKAPNEFNPTDPQNARLFTINICVQFQPELKITETLQTAKLTRSILENERDFVTSIGGAEVSNPYVFVVLFSDNAVTDNAIPGLNAAQIKTGIKALFLAENMIADFAA